MANPQVQFAGLDLSNATIFSTQSNFNSFIRVKGDFTAGSPNVTNVVNQNAAGGAFYGTSSIMPGMFLMSSGETSKFTRIVSYDQGTGTIVLAENATGTATTATNVRIAPPKGMYFVKSGSFNKAGTGAPQDWRAVTGSEDSEYDNTEPKWGVVAQLANTSSPTSGITGLYGQYTITKIQDRISSNVTSFFITSSTTVNIFKEESDKCIAATQGVMLLSSMENNLMTIAAAGDAGTNQGYGLAAYQTAVGGQIAALTSASGAGFPFTGSAQITGSIGLTGSQANLIQTAEQFIIKNAQAPTQSLFEVKGDGTAVFRARVGGDGAPTPILGGLYFTTSSVFVGIN